MQYQVYIRITSRRLLYASTQHSLFTRMSSASCPSQRCWASSQLISHPSIKQAGKPSAMCRDKGSTKGKGLFSLLPNQWTGFAFDRVNHDMARHSERPRDIVSSCFKRAKWRLFRGYHRMHVAASGGSVPGSKRTNKLAVSCRKRHHWPNPLPNA